jgi:hypothetical protein
MDDQNYALQLRVVFRHYKTEQLYEILPLSDMVMSTETGERLILYYGVEEDGTPHEGIVWARPATMFFGYVDTDKGVVPRFAVEILLPSSEETNGSQESKEGKSQDANGRDHRDTVCID